MQKTTIFITVVGALAAIGIGILIGHYAIPNDERGFVDNKPLDFRRTTFVVYNMEDSLDFYERGLGIIKIYDKVIINPPEASSVEESDKWRRLVFLRANNEFIGN